MLKKFKQALSWLLGYPANPPLHFPPQTVMINHEPYLMTAAQRKDIDQLVEIERLIYTIPPWDAPAFIYDLHRPNALILVVKKDDQVVAYAGVTVNFNAQDAHLTNVATHPDYQGQGIGTVMLRHLMQYALHQQLASLSLEVRANNTVAQHLYTRLGFTRVGVRRHYYQEDDQDAYTMILKLKDN